MTCERGSLQVAVTLAPTMPPKVQYLAVRSIMPMSEAMAGAVSRIAALLPPGAEGRGNEAAASASSSVRDGLAAVLAPSVDRAAVEQMFAVASPLGGCRLGVVLDGDGIRATSVRLSCARGNLDLSVGLDEATGKVTRLVLAPAGGNACGR